MNVEEFISDFRNHPVMFFGTGMSLRYLENSYTWDGLLDKVCYDLTENAECYLDIKAKHLTYGSYDFAGIATDLESLFHEVTSEDRNGKFKSINDEFYRRMKSGEQVSRFKIYISELLASIDIKSEKEKEIELLQSASKNISSFITTNYDTFCENTVDFKPLIGNDILLSNPYGSTYKVHGCTTAPEKIILTKEDYENFNNKYELIRAQLISIFLHNPIIFMGYSVTDENIKSILKTIFSYVELNSEQANKVKNNFLLVEFESNSNSLEVVEHDIEIEGLPIIRINKIKTDDFSTIYKSLAELSLPVSAMDVRKVQNIVKTIAEGGTIKVQIADDVDDLNNEDMVLAISSTNAIKYEHKSPSDFCTDYFKIIDNNNAEILKIIDRLTIPKTFFFPIYKYSEIAPDLKRVDKLKIQQAKKIEDHLKNIPDSSRVIRSKISEILDENSTNSYRANCILWNSEQGHMPLEEVEGFLRNKPGWLQMTDFKRLLCSYDRRACS